MSKKGYLTGFLVLFFGFIVKSQVPQGINYQGVARDASGQVLKGVALALQFDIYDNASGGNLLFTEAINKTSDAQTGIFTHIIGTANPTSFQALNWGIGTKHLQVSVNGSVTARQQLMSVPYALYAASAGSSGTPSLSINGNSLSISGGNTVTFSPASTLTITPNALLNSSSSGSNYTLNVTPQTFTQVGNTFTSNYGGSFTVPSATTLVAPTTVNINSPHTATSNSSASGTTVNININGPTGTGTLGYLPVWTGTNSLASSNAFQASNGAIVVGTGTTSGSAPFVVNNYSSGTGISIHQGSNTSTGLTFNTNSLAPHSIGTIDNKDLGFFSGSVNTLGNFPFSVKTNSDVEVGYGLNMRGNTAAPIVSTGGQGRIYFDGLRFKVSENGGAYQDMLSGAIWSKSGSNITTLLNSDNVGIGLTTPTAKLDVLGLTKLNNTGSDVLTVSQTGAAANAGVFSSMNGQAISASSSNSRAIYAVSSSPSNHALEVLNTSATTSVLAGYFNGGLGVIGKTGTGKVFDVSNSSNITLLNVFSSGNVGINTNTPGYRLSVLDGTSGLAAIYGANSNTSNATAHGVQGVANNGSNLAAGVYGNGSNAATGVIGESAGATGVWAKTNGSAAALVASSGTTATSALALLLENGHVKVTGSVQSISVTTNSLGGATATTAAAISPCNDVKGTVTINSNLTGVVNGSYIDVTVDFAKNYNTQPTVIITPGEPSRFEYSVISQGTNTFVVRIINNSGTTISFVSPYNYFRFNYLVIE